MRTKLGHNFEDIVSVYNLLLAWNEFAKGKRGKRDVQEFSLKLMDNILDLHSDLKNKRYRHGGYYAFNISDPKPRNIHKARVRDRLVHHAVYRVLYPFFDRTFVADSYSCRLGRGTHKAIERLVSFNYTVGKNNTKTCWVLKCDIKKFFASIDQKVLVRILRQHIPDEDIIWILKEIVSSFHSSKPGKGLPLGNLTSQLFVNIYMNEFDQFAKHRLKAKYYIRYADDFVVLSWNKKWLLELIPQISEFLDKELKLSLHPGKISIKTIASGIDFLGWVVFKDHKILRTTTERRLFKGLKSSSNRETLNSYFGLLKHGNSYNLKDKIVKSICEL